MIIYYLWHESHIITSMLKDGLDNPKGDGHGMVQLLLLLQKRWWLGDLVWCFWSGRSALLECTFFSMLHWMIFEDQKKGKSMVIDQPRVIECSKTRVSNGVSMAWWCQWLVGIPGMAMDGHHLPESLSSPSRVPLQVFANCTQIAASRGTKFGGLASIWLHWCGFQQDTALGQSSKSASSLHHLQLRGFLSHQRGARSHWNLDDFAVRRGTQQL